jgi:hypothetical protein
MEGAYKNNFRYSEAVVKQAPYDSRTNPPRRNRDATNMVSNHIIFLWCRIRYGHGSPGCASKVAHVKSWPPVNFMQISPRVTPREVVGFCYEVYY